MLLKKFTSKAQEDMARDRVKRLLRSRTYKRRNRMLERQLFTKKQRRAFGIIRVTIVGTSPYISDKFNRWALEHVLETYPR